MEMTGFRESAVRHLPHSVCPDCHRVPTTCCLLGVWYVCGVHLANDAITPQSGGIFGTWNGTLGSGDFRIKPSADNAGNNNRFRNRAGP
jgi:hypothetical protein